MVFKKLPLPPEAKRIRDANFDPATSASRAMLKILDEGGFTYVLTRADIEVTASLFTMWGPILIQIPKSSPVATALRSTLETTALARSTSVGIEVGANALASVGSLTEETLVTVLLEFDSTDEISVGFLRPVVSDPDSDLGTGIHGGKGQIIATITCEGQCDPEDWRMVSGPPFEPFVFRPRIIYLPGPDIWAKASGNHAAYFSTNASYIAAGCRAYYKLVRLRSH